MSRPLRIEYPGAFYHITTRGNGGNAIFFNDNDRILFLNIYAAVCKRTNWRCHAYCLMNNHYHFVIETPEGNLSKGMRQLNGVYTEKFNHLHARTGHIFQGRYTAILIEKDAYLKELCRYVALNPVRAHMVKKPEDWHWSSYRATAGITTKPPWLNIEWLLSQFAPKKRQAQQEYINFILAGAPPIWDKLRHQIYLGNEGFVECLLQDHGKGEAFTEIPRTQKLAPLPLTHYVEAYPDQKIAMAMAFLSGDYTLAGIAKHFGVHYTTVSRAVKNYEQRK